MLVKELKLKPEVEQTNNDIAINNTNYYLLRSFCVPGTVLNTYIILFVHQSISKK